MKKSQFLRPSAFSRFKVESDVRPLVQQIRQSEQRPARSDPTSTRNLIWKRYCLPIEEPRLDMA